MRMFFSFWYWESIFLMGNLCLTFGQKGRGQRGFLAFAISQLPWPQNNHYTKVAVWGCHVLIASSELQKCFAKSFTSLSRQEAKPAGVWMVFRILWGMASWCGCEVLHFLLHLLYLRQELKNIAKAHICCAWLNPIYTFTFHQSLIHSITDYQGVRICTIFSICMIHSLPFRTFPSIRKFTQSSLQCLPFSHNFQSIISVLTFLSQ